MGQHFGSKIEVYGEIFLDPQYLGVESFFYLCGQIVILQALTLGLEYDVIIPLSPTFEYPLKNISLGDLLQ